MIDADALIAIQTDSLARAGDGLRRSWPPETAMDAAELGTFLAEPRYCVLATASREGHPVARPVSFVTLGAALWFATVEGVRLRHLTRTPWASVVIEDGASGAHRAVAVDGPVAIHHDPPAEVPAAWCAREGSSAEWAAAWCELRPARLLSYSAARAATH